MNVKNQLRTHIIQRNGFTLFETLLALALTLVLILAIQSALMLHWKYRTAGAEQTQESLTKLAVIEDIRSDLRLANSGVSPTDFLKVNELKSVQTGSLIMPDFADGPEIKERFLQYEPETTHSQPIGLIGSDQLLVFNVNFPSYRFEKSMNPTPGQKTIAWFVNRGEAVKIPLQRHGQNIHWKTFEASQLPLGLVRVELNSESDSQGNLFQSSLIHRKCELIDATATSIDFDYLLQTKTLDDWDSLDRKCLPAAISISILREDQSQQATISLPQSNARILGMRST